MTATLIGVPAFYVFVYSSWLDHFERAKEWIIKGLMLKRTNDWKREKALSALEAFSKVGEFPSKIQKKSGTHTLCKFENPNQVKNNSKHFLIKYSHRSFSAPGSLTPIWNFPKSNWSADNFQTNFNLEKFTFFPFFWPKYLP